LCQISKWFYDNFIGAATVAVGCGSFVSELWSLAMDERGEHEDLRGFSRRSVIPYVHKRIELYCSSMYELETFFFLPPVLTDLFFLTLVKKCLPDSFIAQGRVVIMKPGGSIGGLEVVETLYSI
jgi:hypothetical protein